MGRTGKIALAVLAVLAVVLVLNTVAVEHETRDAKVTMLGGHILQLNSGDVQVVETGPEDADPIVLVHCYTCSSRWWDRMVPDLARKHRVIRIDLRGHGGSEKPSSGYTMDEQAQLVAQAMARLDVERATVVGHSLGGIVVVALAQQSPDLVKRLVIMDTAPDNEHYGGIGFLARLGYIPVIGQAGWKIKTRFTIKRGLEQAFAPGYDVPEQFVDDVERMTYSAYDRTHADHDAYTEQEPLDERLGTAPPPLLVVFGTEDQLFDIPETPDAYRDVPGAKVELVDGAGHSPNVEKPLETARLILDFIATSRPASPSQQGDQRSKKRRERDARRDGEGGGRNSR